MQLFFEKYHGAGNDFIILSQDSLLPTYGEIEDIVRKVCDRHYGVGADGLFLVQEVNGSECQVEFYNSDGSRARMCGNGARCVSAYLFERLQTSELTLLLEDVRVSCTRLANGLISVHIPTNGVVEWLPAEGGYLLNTGGPHLVLECEDKATLEALDLEEVARPLRYAVCGDDGGGVNVDYYTLKDGRVSMRTYERGVEGETLACGTGAVAVALVASAVYDLPSPVEVTSPGGHLTVRFERVINEDESHLYHEIYLIGEAVLIARGVLIDPPTVL